MKRCKGVLLAGMLVLSMSVPVYADKSVVVKVEAPADTKDYYMTVDSGGVGVDIYPSTDGKGENLTAILCIKSPYISLLPWLRNIRGSYH